MARTDIRTQYTVAAAVNDSTTLEQNLLRSPDLAQAAEVVVLRDCASAATAYNAALDRARHDVVVLVHQDVYLPHGWFDALSRALAALQAEGVPWGVLGCFGVSAAAPQGAGRIYSTGWGRIGTSLRRPEPVDTLDEIVLVLRRSSGLRFDERLPHFHLYGTDICLEARARGWPSYAFPGYCVHNTRQLLALPDDFYRCYAYVKAKWRRYLPIRTPCITISRFDADRRWRRMRAAMGRRLGEAAVGANRVADPRPYARDEMETAPAQGAPAPLVTRCD
jgi:hypothetical protein